MQKGGCLILGFTEAIHKYNQNHGADGRFSSKTGAGLIEPTAPGKKYKDKSEWDDMETFWHEMGLGAPLTPEYKQYLHDKDNYTRQKFARIDAQNREIKEEWEKRGGDKMDPPKKATQTEYEGFNTKTTGTSHYDQFLDPKDLRYQQERKGRTGYIAEMSPSEYIERCAKQIFHSTVERQERVRQVGNGEKNIMDYASKMQNGVKFDMPYLDYTDTRTQEGRHRALAAQQAGISKMPVLIVEPYIQKGDSMKEFTIAKTEPDKMQVFGYASVAQRADGTEVVDHEEDVVTPEELEKAAYSYVLEFRDTGERHDPGLRKKGKLIESVVLTKEKQQAMGIPEGILPIAWWVGFQINDKEAWEKIKTGEYQMFSVEGSANREEYSEDLKKGIVAKSFIELVEKYNPYHGKDGRFASRDGHASFSPGKDPTQAARSIAAENAKRKADGEDEDINGAYYHMDRKTKAEIDADKKMLAAQAAPKPKKPRQPKAQPKDAGQHVDWKKMSDDEFVANIETYIPGAKKIGKKWANSNAPREIDTHKEGDMVLSDIYTERGYHGKPTMMDRPA